MAGAYSTQEMRLQLCELTVAMLSPLYTLQPAHFKSYAEALYSYRLRVLFCRQLPYVTKSAYSVYYRILNKLKNNLGNSHTINTSNKIL